MNSRVATGLLLLLAVGVLGGFLWLAAAASPVFGGPALAGLIFPSAIGPVTVPGQYLRCAAGSPGDQQAVCALDVAGQPVTVAVTFTDDSRWDFSACQADYAGKSVTCLPVQRVVQGPALAGVDANALGLSEAAVQAVAARFPASTWHEINWTTLGLGAAVLAGLSLGLAAALWLGRPAPSGRFWLVFGLAALGFFLVCNIALLTVTSGLALVD